LRFDESFSGLSCNNLSSLFSGIFNSLPSLKYMYAISSFSMVLHCGFRDLEDNPGKFQILELLDEARAPDLYHLANYLSRSKNQDFVDYSAIFATVQDLLMINAPLADLR
jgi:hypothetical protein